MTTSIVGPRIGWTIPEIVITFLRTDKTHAKCYFIEMESNGSCNSKEIARRNSWQYPNILVHAQMLYIAAKIIFDETKNTS